MQSSDGFPERRVSAFVVHPSAATGLRHAHENPEFLEPGKLRDDSVVWHSELERQVLSVELSGFRRRSGRGYRQAVLVAHNRLGCREKGLTWLPSIAQSMIHDS